MTKLAAERTIDQQQWSMWCFDNKTVQDRGLGLANCIICSTEPQEVLAWDCGPGACSHASHDPETVIHVKFVGCGHHVDVIHTEEAARRMYG